MISFIKGNIDTILQNSIIIDVSGVGYHVYVAELLILNFEVGQNIKLYTHLHTNENKFTLFGFEKYEDVLFFELLTSVSGIGPKVALGLLNKNNAQQIMLYIITEDVKMLKKAPGIGEKTASRLVLELKDKINKIKKEIFEKIEIPNKNMGANIDDSISALLALGYNSKDVYNVVLKISKNAVTTEEIIKLALKELSSF
ncbi:MAG: Holliday junction branch migration protein RuvA [Defluviitaleaceae bacterium]|nr:Holliday junction branch migration protein RuvA [Defluviitaleaceae bacterium]